MFEINTQIIKCGLRYNARLDFSEIKVYGESWSVTVPEKRLREFVRIFPERDWEGAFLHDLTGTYVRLVLDEDGRIHALRHITDSLEYIM